tara:strand:- start:37 stop:318 length:282 start_codon:yes stop_codon:yes gene_type:complete
MKPSEPKGVLFPSAENSLEDTKRFLIRISVFPLNKQMKIIDDFLRSLANQNRMFKTLIVRSKNGNESKTLEKHSFWCVQSSALAVKHRAKLED